jgi:Condensation domain/Phosphopantetheine attachment site/Thioesterase domain
MMTTNREMMLEKYLRKDPRYAASRAAVTPMCREGETPLSFEQQQQWRLAQAAPDIPLYRECVTLRLPGPLDVATLERSFSEIIRRHEAWRTSFPLVDGVPVQRIHPPHPIRLPLVDLSDRPAPTREAEAVQIASADAQAPFDLSSGPLLRATLVRLDDTEHRLYLTLHTTIVDCSCLADVFLLELQVLYDAFRAGKSSPLPPLPLQYADYANWQRHALGEEALAKHLVYWKLQLHDAPYTIALPTDRPRSPAHTYQGDTYGFAFPERLSDDIKALSRREGVTMFMTLIAAFATLLYRMSGQTDIVIGTASGTNRLRPEFHGMLGRMVNTLALRIDLSGNPSFLDLLRRTRAITGEAYSHQDAPFDLVLESLQAERVTDQASKNGQLSVMLLLEPPPTVLECGWTFAVDAKTATSACDLSLVVSDGSAGLAGRWEYFTDLFHSSSIAQMAAAWQSLLDSIVRDPSQRISHVSCPILTVSHPSISESTTPYQPAPSTEQTREVADTAPRTLLQQQLVAIWGELLAARPIGIRDNFFDLGGHSLLAARAITRIEQACGKTISVADFFADATIEHVAEHLLAMEEPASQAAQAQNLVSSSYPMVTEVHKSGSRQPLFFFHGNYHGSPIWVMQMARDLGPDQPVYLFEPGRLDGRVAPTLEAYVTEQLKVVLSTQPEGPYLLGGSCGGAVVAFEIAQQLRARGQQVALLALMEPAVLSAPIRLLHATLRHLERAVGLNPEHQLDWFVRLQRVYDLVGTRYRHLRADVGAGRAVVSAATRATLGALKRETKRLGQRLHPAMHLATGPDDLRMQATQRPREDTNRILAWLFAEYRVRPYPGRVTLLRFSEEQDEGPAARRLAREIAACAVTTETRVLEGNYISCRTDHVHDMARTLQACIPRQVGQ